MVGRRTAVIGPCGCCGNAPPPPSGSTNVPCAEALVYNSTSTLYESTGSIPYAADETPVWSIPDLPNVWSADIPTISNSPGSCGSSCHMGAMVSWLNGEISGGVSLTGGGNARTATVKSYSPTAPGYPTLSNSCPSGCLAWVHIDLFLRLSLCYLSNSYSIPTSGPRLLATPTDTSLLYSGKMAVLLSYSLTVFVPDFSTAQTFTMEYGAHFPGDTSLPITTQTFELLSTYREEIGNNACSPTGCAWNLTAPATLTLTAA